MYLWCYPNLCPTAIEQLSDPGGIAIPLVSDSCLTEVEQTFCREERKLRRQSFEKKTGTSQITTYINTLTIPQMSATYNLFRNPGKKENLHARQVNQ